MCSNIKMKEDLNEWSDMLHVLEENENPQSDFQA